MQIRVIKVTVVESSLMLGFVYNIGPSENHDWFEFQDKMATIRRKFVYTSSKGLDTNKSDMLT